MDIAAQLREFLGYDEYKVINYDVIAHIDVLWVAELAPRVYRNVLTFLQVLPQISLFAVALGWSGRDCPEVAVPCLVSALAQGEEAGL